MNRSRSTIALGLACLLAVMLAFLQTGCGGANRRQVALRGQLEALKGARDKFIKYERASELAIANSIEKQDPARAAVDAFRIHVRDPIVAAFAGAFEDLGEAAASDDEDPLMVVAVFIARLVAYVDHLPPPGSADPGAPPCSPPCSRF